MNAIDACRQTERRGATAAAYIHGSLAGPRWHGGRQQDRVNGDTKTVLGLQAGDPLTKQIGFREACNLAHRAHRLVAA